MANGKTICTACNYIYDEALGEPAQNIGPSVEFDVLPDEWRCPVCNSSKEMFQPCSCVTLHTFEQTCITPRNRSVERQNSSLAGEPIGQIVAEHPEYACLFEQYELDYCCGGKRTLQEACEQKGVNVDEVIEKVLATRTLSAIEADWTETSLKQLVEHIISSYHQPLREELPRLSQLAEKVANVHGERHPEMIELADVFKRFKEKLELHMQKEVCGVKYFCRPYCLS